MTAVAIDTTLSTDSEITFDATSAPHTPFFFIQKPTPKALKHLQLRMADPSYRPLSQTEDGHYVGIDGFIFPNNFAEFYARFPRYVSDWARRRVAGRTIVGMDKEDYTSDLLLHLMTMPKDSKYSEPGSNGLPEGCKDRLQMFYAPGMITPDYLSWKHFVNSHLSSRYLAIFKHMHTNPMFRITEPDCNNLDETGSDNPLEMAIQFDVHADYADRVHMACDPKLVHSLAYVGEFLRFLRAHNPELMPVLTAMAENTTLIESMDFLGMDSRMFLRSRNRIKTLYECFKNSLDVPKQRKVYRLPAKASTGRFKRTRRENPCISARMQIEFAANHA